MKLHDVQVDPSSVVDDASNVTVCPMSGVAGLKVKAAVGAVAFEGFTEIDITRVFVLSAFVPTGVAMTRMEFPIDPDAGALTLNVAVPCELVVTSVSDNEAPAGLLPPSDTISRWPTMGRLLGSRAITVTTD